MQITQKPVQKRQIQPKQQQSMWKLLINGIVRPPRANYKQSQLGLKMFSLNQSTYFRRDEVIEHQSKYRLFVTIFQPQYKSEFNPLVLYLHGNSSSKLESLSILRHLPIGFSLAAFDFIGCGLNREGETISLGYRQSEQAETVTEYLRNKGFQVILWGRSMGAASALRYGNASVIVADSSFKSLRSLCKQVAKNQAPRIVPNCLISCCFPCVFLKLKKDVEEKGNYDMDEIDIKQSVKAIDPETSIIFLTGDEDLLVHHRNSQKLYESFTGKHKYLQIFKGNHNSKRPQELLKKVMEIVRVEFYRKKYPHLCQKEDIKIQLNKV